MKTELIYKQTRLQKQKTVGDQLRFARRAQKKAVEEIAKTIKVSAQYLYALEEGRYADMPSAVYVKNYLKLYADFLGIRWEKIEQQYHHEIAAHQASGTETEIAGMAINQHTGQQQKRGSMGGHQRHALMIPSLLKFGGFAIGVLLIVLYFVWGLVQFLSPPELIVYTPDQDIVVTERTVVITGETEPEAIVLINGQEIPIEPDGRFEEDISLHEGLNTIRIVTKSKLRKERSVVRYVLYDTTSSSDSAAE